MRISLRREAARHAADPDHPTQLRCGCGCGAIVLVTLPAGTRRYPCPCGCPTEIAVVADGGRLRRRGIAYVVGFVTTGALVIPAPSIWHLLRLAKF
jgi:hypothetical protein